MSILKPCFLRTPCNPPALSLKALLRGYFSLFRGPDNGAKAIGADSGLEGFKECLVKLGSQNDF